MSSIYEFNGEDITMNMIIQIHDVAKIIQERYGVSFIEALKMFYASYTFEAMSDPETGLWAESAPFLADCFFEKRYDPEPEMAKSE